MMQPQQSSVSNTTVVVNQAAAPAHKPLRSWTTGLCGCFEDCGVCCCVTFCRPCAEMSLAMDMGENCCIPYLVPGWLVTLRTKIRTQHNIHGSVLDDCCLVYFCYECALCQTMREVKLTRGT
ncbi:placenta-specific gene 8 protein-like [Pomacea canaliculata]|uniref:placenta-specific gene 8 protein-like n=1 Tax=Pomacea canaliculata TaxID=400727 RepID=UPI000D73401D|nr:placenta-specific gene 8 protein-like [Pomacea canaliculata]